jgi:hypothetical protein
MLAVDAAPIKLELWDHTGIINTARVHSGIDDKLVGNTKQTRACP